MPQKYHSNRSSNKAIEKPETSKVGWFKVASAIIIPLVVALIGYFGVRITVYAPIWATQTAQAQYIFLTQTAYKNSPLNPTIIPTNSPTPIPTNTSTLEIILLPSPTLEPGLTFVTPLKDELGRLPTIFGEYTDVTTPNTYTYYQSIHSTQPYLWTYEWCAKNQAALDENLKKIEFTFLFSENPIPDDYFLVYEHTTKEWACHTWTTMLTNWIPGNKITLTAQYNIARVLSDGDTNYLPGLYRHDLIITVKP